MRVALVGRWRPESADGVTQVVCHLAQELSHLGHEVELWGASQSAKSITESIVDDGIRVVLLPVRLGGICFSRKVRDFIVKRSAEVALVHFHSCFRLDNCRIAAWLHCPYVVTPHGGYTPYRIAYRNPLRKRLFFYFYTRTYLERAAFIHVLSEAELEGVSALCSAFHFAIIPNGCELPPNVPNTVPLDVSNPRTLLFIGRLDVFVKGLDRLLAAFAAVRQAGSRLIIAGPDHRGGRQELVQLIAQYGLGDSVILRDGVFGEEKERLLSEASIFVQFSRTEGQPLGAIEAMGRGKPVVVTRETNLAEIVEDHGVGWVVGDDGGAAVLRAALSASQAELNERGERGRQVVLREFQWPAIAARLVTAYTEFCQ